MLVIMFVEKIALCSFKDLFLLFQEKWDILQKVMLKAQFRLFFWLKSLIGTVVLKAATFS